jgi:hypothetical protein
MANELEYIPSLKTGSGFEYPVLMKLNGAKLEDILIRGMEVRNDSELAIGDLAIIYQNSGTLTLDATTDENTQAWCIIADTNHNKSILQEGGNSSISKATQFSSEDLIDVYRLVPGVTFSMKFNSASEELDPGTKVACAADGEVKLLAASADDEPACMVGMSETYANNDGSGISYIGVTVK